MNKIVVVGGGILGTMHALEAIERGWKVVHLEREAAPRGASVRNFGLVWVSGRAPGAELQLALRARERWESIAGPVPGCGFRANGSLTAVCDPAEVAVLEGVVARDDAAERGLALLEPDQALRLNPGLGGARTGGPVLAALHCARDAVVEPRRVLGALRGRLLSSERYEWLPGREAVRIGAHRVNDSSGRIHRADLVVLCTGAAHGGPLGELLEGAPLRRVRLQMLETAPYTRTVTTSLADGDSLRYYPGFAVAAREDLAPQSPVAATWAAQLLLVQRPWGGLTIGDTHSYDEPFAFDVVVAPERHLLDVARELLGSDVPAVERRWAGVYSQVTEAAGTGAAYFRAEVADGVQVVTGPGGRGMTLAPAIAQETFA